MSNVDVNYAMFNLGTGELVLIFLVILLLFGAKRLPELARGLGKGINEFKDAVETSKKEIMDAKESAETPVENKDEAKVNVSGMWFNYHIANYSETFFWFNRTEIR